jgi:hypothetical protein
MKGGECGEGKPDGVGFAVAERGGSTYNPSS